MSLVKQFNSNVLADGISVKLGNLKETARSQAPSFFAPYKNFKDFGGSLVAPVTAPFFLGVVTGVVGALSALAAVVSAASLIGAGNATVFGNNEQRDSALTLALITGVGALVGTLVTAVCALFTVLSAPLLLASVVARSGATAVSAIRNVCASSAKSNGDDDASPYSDSVDGDYETAAYTA